MYILFVLETASRFMNCLCVGYFISFVFIFIIIEDAIELFLEFICVSELTMAFFIWSPHQENLVACYKVQHRIW